jgi:hypothetical protein
MKFNRPLVLCAMFLALVIALLGHPIAAVSCLFLFEAAIARNLGWCGVNTLGTLATATIVQEALALVFAKRPVLRRISMGFTDRNGSPVAAFNQAVKTRTLGLPTVQNAGAAASGRSDTDVSVTLDQFKQLRYDFTAQEYSGTNRDLIRESAEPMATALANSMVDAVAALWTQANYPVRTGADAVANGATQTKTVKAAGWDYTHLSGGPAAGGIRGILNAAGVPDYGRFYVGNSDVYGSMLTDLRIVGYLNNQSNQEAIRTGTLPDVAGFGLAEYPGLTGVAGGNLVAFAGTPDSTVYAARVPRDPREVIPGLAIPGNVGIVTEPRTGFSVMVVEYVDLSTLTITTKLLWMYGVAVGNANNGQLICSA